MSEHSPFFRILEEPRLVRQEKIRLIEEKTGRRLAVYFANLYSDGNNIFFTDDIPRAELLSDGLKGTDIDLLIQSPGGVIDAAEKWIKVLREECKSYRVIVTGIAKSAATMIALSADEIIMGPNSELGPVDPQIYLQNQSGPTYRSAAAIIYGLDQIKQKVNEEGGLNPAYIPILQNYDPSLLAECDRSIKLAEDLTKQWLRSGVLKHKPEKVDEIAAKLATGKEYLSHGAVISGKDALAYELNVKLLSSDDPLWKMLWDLHLRYEYAISTNRGRKIFETNRISLPF